MTSDAPSLVIPPSGLIIVDKSGGMTSHDVVARVRRIAHTRRVGHAGTLDPMATGVLVVGTEKATRLLGHLTLTEKTYEATIRLGQSTSTDDAEGELVTATPVTFADTDNPASPVSTTVPDRRVSAETRSVSAAALEAEIGTLTGEILQVPPGISAIKVNGKRAYKLTRAGEAPELAARPVTVYEFTVTGTRPAGDCLDVDARVRCSSGTYIRALARDLGTALGTGGHLTALRRTAVGPYTLAQAHTLKEIEDQTGAPVPWVTPLADAAAAAFQRLDLTAADARRLAHGARLLLPPGTCRTSQSPIAAFAPDGSLVALVTAESGYLRSLAVFTG
jgi:tRNA pseudouridine55 synthase